MHTGSERSSRLGLMFISSENELNNLLNHKLNAYFLEFIFSHLVRFPQRK